MKKKIRLPPKIFTGDMIKAKSSAHKLTTISADIAVFGHGEPILRKADKKIKEGLRFKGEYFASA